MSLAATNRLPVNRPFIYAIDESPDLPTPPASTRCGMSADVSPRRINLCAIAIRSVPRGSVAAIGHHCRQGKSLFIQEIKN